MSLYGALFSGVSGLAAQSSAMGAISDNIANVNTTGYKGAKVNFNTLVTKQVSLTNYSPGGVQSKPRASVDVQGLLQATNSSTDVGISGNGMFIVNEAANPGNGDMFAYTRAGSFKVDKEGYLQNVSGWFMQGWPLMSWDNSLQASTVQVGNNVYMKGYRDSLGNQVYINDNIVSSTHLQPLNLNNIGGTASQTRNLRMGANLPNGDKPGQSHKQPVTIYDSLGGDATVQFNWKKSAQNNWGVEAIPPLGAKSLTLKNKNAAGNSGVVYGAMGRLDFNGLPNATNGSTMSMQINGTTYQFATKSGTDGAGSSINYNMAASPAGQTLGLTMPDGSAKTFTLGGTSNTAALAAADLNKQFLAAGNGLTASVSGTNISISTASGTSLAINTGTSTGGFATAANWTNSTTAPNVFYTDPSATSVGSFVGNLASDINTAFNIEYNSLNIDCAAGVPANTKLSLFLNGATSSTTYTFPGATTDAASTAAALNSQFSTAGNGLKAVVNGTSVSIYSENAMSFKVDTNAANTDAPFSTAANWTDGSGNTGVISKTTTGTTYCEQLAGTNSLVFRQTDASNAVTVAGLSSMKLANGNPATMQAQDLNAPDTFSLAAAPDSSKSAIEFNGDGTPKEINVAFIDVDWANGSTDMSGADSIGLFLGNTGIKDGMTQLNGDYQLNYWTQNGAKFGNFSGVSIGQDGIVTALFDNGVTRPVFQIPIATFTNVNGMQSLTGNVFISTDNSGEPTLRAAGSAGAGQVNSASLEASTVDIGTEFTTMIVTQRAYSAASKIITTADQMLDELVQIKR